MLDYLYLILEQYNIIVRISEKNELIISPGNKYSNFLIYLIYYI